MVATTALEMPAQPAMSHVRAVSEHARRTLAEGLSRSSTIARLVNELNASDVIVFIDTRVDPAMPTGETMLMATTPSVRYVRVILNPRMTVDERVEYLGHELQHAAEIAEDAGAVDSQSMRKRFSAIGRELGASTQREKSFETEGARLVSVAVRRELSASRGGSGPH